MSLSQPRNSHERNLEKRLEEQSARTSSHDVPPGKAAAPGVARAEQDIAGRLAREAAEREAVRRASERSEGDSEP